MKNPTILSIDELAADGHVCHDGCWPEEGFHRTKYGTCPECGTCGDPECCPGGCDCRWPKGVKIEAAS